MRLRRLTILVAAGAALLVPAASARAATFSNSGPIAINDATAATPYPSSVPVAGVIGTVTKVTATLHGFHHTCPVDVDSLLVGPHGQESILMSDVGDCQSPGAQPAPIELTFDDSAAPVPCLPGSALPGGTYQPTNGQASDDTCTADPTNQDIFSPPAPPGPYGVGLAAFNGVDPNGTWSLYLVDQSAGDTGAIDGGWTLNLTIPPGTLATAPRISGRPGVGRTLTAVSGTLGNGATPAYQWLRCNRAGSGCVAISGATKGIYRPVRADKGHTLEVTETGVTSGGSSAPLTSSATKAIGPAVLSTSGTKKSQNVLRQSGLIALVKSNIGGRLSASATVSVRHAATTVRFKTVKKSLRAGRRTKVKLKLSKGARSAISGALARGTKLRAKLTLTVTDASGGTARKRLTIRLR